MTTKPPCRERLEFAAPPGIPPGTATIRRTNGRRTVLDVVDDAIDLGTEDSSSSDSSLSDAADSGSTSDGDNGLTGGDEPAVVSDSNGQLRLSEKVWAELDQIKLPKTRSWLGRCVQALFDRATLLANCPGRRGKRLWQPSRLTRRMVGQRRFRPSRASWMRGRVVDTDFQNKKSCLCERYCRVESRCLLLRTALR